MWKEAEESSELACTNGYQNPKYLERTFEEVWGTEADDNNGYDDYFPLDEND
jgi:hypothetical protein